jgi:hypothetical protein
MPTPEELQRQLHERHLRELLGKIAGELEAIRKAIQEAAKKLR